MKPIQLLNHAFKKLLLRGLFQRYVINDKVVQADIKQTLQVRGSKLQNDSMEKQFSHLMLYYPDYALVFFWRINKLRYCWRNMFMNELTCKIFRSTAIAGGLICYHPFATVINAKSIGKNFQFRNCLTIGNKNNDNSRLPIIGNDVTVGSNVVIIGDITIGDHVVIGAGSVVVKDIPSYCIVAGNPAEVIKRID